MSGHSKWATIKRQKGAADQKRGQTFTKLSIAITLAVRLGGGGEAEQNFRLRLAIEKARLANMPKDNIERAIEKGMGRGAGGEEMQEVVYEGFGPSGIGAIVVEAVTDNRQRTTGEVKNIFDKAGGTFGQPGCVSYQFENKGVITIEKGSMSFDDILLLAADAGADDGEEVGEEVFIYTKPEALNKIREALATKVLVKEAELVRKPTVTQQVTDTQTFDKITALIDKLEMYDDVQKVYTNIVLSDDLASKYE